ncbi:unnamed protein product, partial [Closterium sp. NIES-53]
TRPRRLLDAALPPATTRPHHLHSRGPAVRYAAGPATCSAAAPPPSLLAPPSPPLHLPTLLLWPRHSTCSGRAAHLQQPSSSAAEPPRTRAALPPSRPGAEPPRTAPPCARAALPLSRPGAEPPCARAAQPHGTRAAWALSRLSAELHYLPCLVSTVPLSLRARSLLLALRRCRRHGYP